jgi:hypothetical protein
MELSGGRGRVEGPLDDVVDAELHAGAPKQTIKDDLITFGAQVASPLERPPRWWSGLGGHSPGRAATGSFGRPTGAGVHPRQP